jgi:hypothetical protein
MAKEAAQWRAARGPLGGRCCRSCAPKSSLNSRCLVPKRSGAGKSMNPPKIFWHTSAIAAIGGLHADASSEQGSLPAPGDGHRPCPGACICAAPLPESARDAARLRLCGPRPPWRGKGDCPGRSRRALSCLAAADTAVSAPAHPFARDVTRGASPAGSPRLHLRLCRARIFPCGHGRRVVSDHPAFLSSAACARQSGRSVETDRPKGRLK